MKIIYFMPVLMREWAADNNRQDILEYCEFFSLLNLNACVIDRTDSLGTPFQTRSLYDLPKYEDFSNLTFADECRRHARQILQTDDHIFVLYSGGMDSTTVVLSLFEAIKDGAGSFEQVTIAATPHSIIENPETWERYILPNFKIVDAGNVLFNLDGSDRDRTRLLTGENGDQLFGSDVLLDNMHLLSQDITPGNIDTFVRSRAVKPYAYDATAARLTKLFSNSRVPLRTMGEAIWWLNFSCKWQSVTLRYLAFSKLIQSGDDLSRVRRLGTFFNTPQFQWVTMFGGLERWGTPPSLQTYKAEMRRFIKEFPGMSSYAEAKVKIPSLYRLFSVSPAQHPILAVDENDVIHGLTSFDDVFVNKT